MPTIFASKVFQNQYKAWSRELAENPYALETTVVVKQLLSDLQSPPPTESNSLKWRMRELKGKEILSEFTDLFFEMHKVTEPQAKILYTALSQILPYDDPTLKSIGKQLIVNEEPSFLSDNSRVRELQVKLDKKIESVQLTTKDELRTQKLKEKKSRRLGKFTKPFIATGYVLAGAFMISLFITPAIPIAGFVALAIFGIVAILVVFAFVAVKKEKKYETTQAELDATNRNVRDIDWLIYLRNITQKKEFETFLDQIDEQDLTVILSNDQNIRSLLERCYHDNYTFPLPDWVLKNDDSILMEK